ncbi:uncharacterized protein [Amphiura filiformis]|uniref:uncharacterized protein n=1 Tax=Amphiura filiformis TaxID=82378 RepID=UPI003B218154
MEIIIHCSVFIAILAAFPVFCSDILDNATLVEPMPEQESPPIVTMSKYEGHFKESYSGKPEENLELFLARFELNSQLRDFADAKKHLALNLRLKGNASIWVSTLPDGQKDTYAHLKAALIEHFQGNDMKWVNESKLSSRIQTEAESLDDYFSDILTLCHRLGKSEQEKLTHFICGLKPNLRAFVISKEPESIDKAVHFARLAQTVTNLPSTPSVNLEQRKDSFAAKMIRYLEIGDLPDDNKEARNILLESEHYFLHEDWDDYLPSIQFAYRTSSTDNSVGFSPFFLLYGREAILPMDVALLEPERLTDRTVREHIKQLVTQLETTREISKHHLQQNQQTMKKRYDQHATDVQYQVGDSVFIYFPVTQPGLSKKLCKHWCGPYLIIKQSSPVNFMVRNLENNKLLKAPIHANRMKFAYNRYVRPANNELPVDLQAQAPVAVLDDTDLPKDSFEPLLAKQTVKDSVILPVPGLPAHKKQTDKLYAVEKSHQRKIRQR